MWLLLYREFKGESHWPQLCRLGRVLTAVFHSPQFCASVPATTSGGRCYWVVHLSHSCEPYISRIVKGQACCDLTKSIFALQTQYLGNTSRESFQIWRKCSFWLKEELIRICRVNNVLYFYLSQGGYDSLTLRDGVFCSTVIRQLNSYNKKHFIILLLNNWFDLRPEAVHILEFNVSSWKLLPWYYSPLVYFSFTFLPSYPCRSQVNSLQEVREEETMPQWRQMGCNQRLEQTLFAFKLLCPCHPAEGSVAPDIDDSCTSPIAELIIGSTALQYHNSL